MADAVGVQPRMESRVAAAGFRYQVERSARRTRTMQLLVRPDGGVLVRAPFGVPTREIAGMVDAKTEWVLRRQAELADGPKIGGRAFVTGETLLVDGAEALLEVKRGIGRGRPRVEFVGGLMSVVVCEDSLVARANAIARWFGGRTRARSESLIGEWGPRMGVRPSGLIVKDQKRRWGSCASSGVVRLNWRLSMLPPECFEYVVVHELAHLKQANHSPLFWGEVAAVLPEYAARKALVRAFERRIDW